ncbi:transporter [Microbaculum marinum]|uniref:Transporter n=1 Tax=Microbaculum marinum TaxID=1764581 RepID=A0AAW9RWJ1_9HYPH
MWLFAFIPVIAATAGAAWTVFSRPGPSTVGAIQHFAAGVVFYAAAGELLPEAVEQGAIWPVVLGGGAGIVVMLLLRRVGDRFEDSQVGLLSVSTLDSFIDGLVLGLAFAIGQSQGLLLAIALGIEFLFLGLAIAGSFAKTAGSRTVIAMTFGVALAVPVGVLAALPASALPGSWQAAAFAFGLVALLYLVTEELLVEAHEKPETNWGTAMFFVGFLCLTIIDELLIGG